MRPHSFELVAGKACTRSFVHVFKRPTGKRQKAKTENQTKAGQRRVRDRSVVAVLCREEFGQAEFLDDGWIKYVQRTGRISRA